MNAGAGGEAQRRNGRRAFWLLLAAALATLLILANVHLVYVAVGSQPDCVPHTKAAGENGAFRAARPAC
jgi:hypothetical protein